MKSLRDIGGSGLINNFDDNGLFIDALVENN
jgi:hypothetical protein